MGNIVRAPRQAGAHFLKSSAGVRRTLAAGPIFAPGRAEPPRPSRSAMSARRPARSRPSARPTASCSISAKPFGRASRRAAPAPVKVKVNDSQSKENRAAGRRRSDPRRQGRSAAGRLDAGDHQSGVRRPRPTKCRASRRWRRGSPGSSGAAKPGVRWPSNTPIITSGASRTSSAPTPRCGTSSTPTRSSAASSPTTATATPGATRTRHRAGLAASCGYKVIDPGRFPDLNDNFSNYIGTFKKENAEIVTGVVIPPDIGTFWNQAAQQNFKPKVVTVGKALLFPVVIDGLGAAANNLSSELWWAPTWPYKSSLTGESGAVRCLYQGDRPAMDAASSALPTRCSRWRPTSSSAPRVPERGRDLNAIKSTNLETVVGPIKWGAAAAMEQCLQDADGRRPVARDQRRQVKNEIIVVANTTAPQIPVAGKMESIGHGENRHPRACPGGPSDGWPEARP